MRRIALRTLLVVCLGCSDDDNSMPEPDADLTGTWNLTAAATDPPTTFACSGDHSGMGGTALCASLGVTINQTGAAFTGTSGQSHCGLDWTVNGVVNGIQFTGELVGTDGLTTQRISFSGAVSGTTAVIEPDTFSEDGLSGDCTVNGIYDSSI